MARRKRNSNVLERADRRIESLQSISVELDFGEGLTIEAYNATIKDLRFKLAAYNTALSAMDKLTDDVNNAEQVVMAMSEKMLLGVGSRYGKTSQEYEMAGGVRRRRNNKNKQRLTANSKPANSCHCKHKMSKLLTLWFQSGLLNLCLHKEGVAPSSSSGVGST